MEGIIELFSHRDYGTFRIVSAFVVGDGDGERVTRGAHRRLLWRLLTFCELCSDRDLLPSRDDGAAVAVVVFVGS